MAHQNRPPREAARAIVQALQQAGHVAYLAGGCVRDTLLGSTPKDYDVATDAMPDTVRALWPRSRYVGEAFGVVLVRQWGHDVEVATFRTDGRYEDGRRPTKVTFTDAKHDAQRRDFTINGLFEDPLTPAEEPDVDHGRIIDYVGGRADLDARVIRAIGEPDERFAEDYLRMLRAVRFAARLGFEIEPRTFRAIRYHARYLSGINRERIGQEVLAMLAGPTRTAAAALVQSLHLDGPTLNEQHQDVPLTLLSSLPPEAPVATSLAAWMIDRHVHQQAEAARLPGDGTVSHPLLAAALAWIHTGLTGTARRWRKALSLSNEHHRGIVVALDLLGRAFHWPSLTNAARKRLLADSGWPMTEPLVRALRVQPGLEDWADGLLTDATALLAEGVAPPPLLTGEDLIAAGLEPGPDFGRWLDQVYDAQLEGSLTNRQQAMAYLASIVDLR